jgi:hypothetical protein
MVFADLNHVVASGDTLSSIALKYGMCAKGSGNTPADWADCLGSAQLLADANGLPNVNAIAVGQTIRIPQAPSDIELLPVDLTATPGSPSALPGFWLEWGKDVAVISLIGLAAWYLVGRIAR